MFPPSNNSGTQDTTQDFVNIESIHENMIINKSGIAIMMIGLEAISRELMTEKEQVIQATKIIAELNGETEPYRLIKVQGCSRYFRHYKWLVIIEKDCVGKNVSCL